MKNTFYYVFNNDVYPQYPIEIPENVAGLKVIEKTNGIFLQYVTKDERKNKWATDIIGRNYRSLKAFYCDKILGLCFVQLSGTRNGFSKCSKNDKFDPMIGKAVAICHATGEKIPDFI